MAKVLGKRDRDDRVELLYYQIIDDLDGGDILTIEYYDVCQFLRAETVDWKGSVDDTIDAIPRDKEDYNELITAIRKIEYKENDKADSIKSAYNYIDNLLDQMMDNLMIDK